MRVCLRVGSRAAPAPIGSPAGGLGPALRVAPNNGPAVPALGSDGGVAVRRILYGTRLLRQPGADDAVIEESERMRDEFRRRRREDLRRIVADQQRFPLSTTDPNRGFRPEDLAQLTGAGVSLSFSGSLSPLPASAQQLLLENIAETVRFALDPNHPDRVIELEALRLHFESRGQSEQFIDRPAGRIDATDLYHGHVCVPRSALAASATLRRLRDNPYSGFGTGRGIREDVIAAIGTGMPTTRPQARELTAVAARHRQPFLDALAAILQALVNETTAGVMYHSWEVDKPRLGSVLLPSEHPVRHIFTPFSTHRPEFRLAGNRDCDTLINFGFHVDRRGRITLLPSSAGEIVRAVEILQGWGS